jgi:hypothetical protein
VSNSFLAFAATATELGIHRGIERFLVSERDSRKRRPLVYPACVRTTACINVWNAGISVNLNLSPRAETGAFHEMPLAIFH